MNLTELGKIPHLNTQVIGERTVLLMALWEEGEWHQWLDIKNRMQKFSIVDVTRAKYLGKESAQPNDLLVPFIEFLYQRATFPEVYRLIEGLDDDVHHLATSTAKLRHFFRTQDQIPPVALSSFVKTELEYLIILTRSMFDLLHEIIATLLFVRMRYLDSTAEAKRKQRKMPTSYADIVITNNRIRSPEEIQEKYPVPQRLATEYARHAAFFMEVRAARDKIVHGGNGLAHIFETDKGFCVNPNDRAFASTFTWNESHIYNENLVSLYPWIAHVVFNTIGACNDLLEVFSQDFKFPGEIAPGYRVFIRDPNGDALLELHQVYEGKRAWWGETGIFAPPE